MTAIKQHNNQTATKNNLFGNVCTALRYIWTNCNQALPQTMTLGILREMVRVGKMNLPINMIIEAHNAY